jgi:hypothetical protein
MKFLEKQIPPRHYSFLEKSVMKLKIDQRILAVAAGESILTNNMDEFSDLDLVIVIDHEKYQEVLQDRKKIAESLDHI